MCSDKDGNNGDDEDCDSGESFSDEFISFPVATASLMVIYDTDKLEIIKLHLPLNAVYVYLKNLEKQ